MRLPLFLILSSTIASAGPRVVLLADPARVELAPALQVALANRHLEVASMPAPEGALILDRAAVVQRTAVSNVADAGIWIDEDAGEPQVYVVSADGRGLRRAPLPAGMPPRVFAAIAASLLDEILAPPEAPSIGVDVYVDVHPGATLAPTAPPAVAFVPRDAVAAAAPDPLRAAHALVEVGFTASPASLGLEAEVLFKVAPSVGLGVLGQASQLYDGVADMPSGGRMLAAGMELRHVGSGATHFDVGIAGGVASGMIPDIGSDTGEFAALRLSATRDAPGANVSLSVSPMVLTGFRGAGPIPSLMASLRWQFSI